MSACATRHRIGTSQLENRTRLQREHLIWMSPCVQGILWMAVGSRDQPFYQTTSLSLSLFFPPIKSPQEPIRNLSCPSKCNGAGTTAGLWRRRTPSVSRVLWLNGDCLIQCFRVFSFFVSFFAVTLYLKIKLFMSWKRKSAKEEACPTFMFRRVSVTSGRKTWQTCR